MKGVKQSRWDLKEEQKAMSMSGLSLSSNLPESPAIFSLKTIVDRVNNGVNVWDLNQT